MPEITAEMFRNGCLESIEALMAEGEIYDIEYSPCEELDFVQPHKKIAVNLVLCEDAISRQAAIDLADELKDDLPDNDSLSDMVMSHNEGILGYQTKLSLLPSVTLAKKVGHWTHDGSHWENRWICSECGYKLFEEQTNYCPNCGAKMEDVEE